ncbi:hypothetical protein [Paenibacillus paeoniae]|uniref:Uncharacterized protein n=1 Tax=Paenibacillus paeoniae TaxID=2292705 RepID=A0A371PJZ2_9BACL|nr:hypothetical protein [Paenibacillus paeoniae]REK76107.1 hypothetical protein DX130_03320 [Paenibacillus paeoniae]
MNRFVQGMKEIMLSEEMKRAIVQNNKQSKSVFFTIRKVLVMSACIFLIFAISGLSIWYNGEQKGVFGTITITAYAADGTPIDVESNVSFPLGKYQLTMSSVPGFPLQIASEAADAIKVMTTDGNLISWAPPESQVWSRGSEAGIHPGDTIYWSPLNEHGEMASGSLLKVIAYKNNKMIGTHTIEIKTDDLGYYFGVIVDE